MEKRVLVAALLSALFLAGYSQLISHWYGSTAVHPVQPAGRPETTLSATPQATAQATHLQRIVEEDVIFIESRHLRLEIGASTGTVRRAELKTFQSSLGNYPLEFGGPAPILSCQIGSRELKWTVINSTPNTATFNAVDSEKNNYHILYGLDAENPVLRVQLSSEQPAQRGEDVTLVSSWTRGDNMNGRNNLLEAILITNAGQGKTKRERRIFPLKKEHLVPRGTLVATLSERYFCSSLRPKEGTFAVTILPSTNGMAAINATAPLRSGSFAAELYLGPRDYFYLRRANFSLAIPVGWIGQIGLIFLLVLKWLGTIIGNYGVAIILFSGLVSLLTAPFTLVSLKSMKKMQALKPQIDRLTAANKDDPTRANKEIFELYKQHKVNPLSGCLPMLLQMPILIALFQAISHFIELRGKPFLWIRDLSLPDRLAQLPASLPVLGSDLNILPIIMAGAMYVQSKSSQRNVSVDKNNPASAMMSGPTMSVMFGIMFYRFPSGLVLYWLTNSLLSLAWYRLAK